MKFDLVRPCSMCPFKTDCLEGWLGQGRAQEIANAITKRDGTFSCHETTPASGKARRDEQHCAGALILLEKLENPNQLMRIAERLGLYDRHKLKMDSPVFESEADFVRRHTDE